MGPPFVWLGGPGSTFMVGCPGPTCVVGWPGVHLCGCPLPTCVVWWPWAHLCGWVAQGPPVWLSIAHLCGWMALGPPVWLVLGSGLYFSASTHRPCANGKHSVADRAHGLPTEKTGRLDRFRDTGTKKIRTSAHPSSGALHFKLPGTSYCQPASIS
ncbi:hypothetical protein FKM82_023192 [Ascaphus truei]